MKQLILIIQLLCSGINEKEIKIQCYEFYTNCLVNELSETKPVELCRKRYKQEVNK